MNECWKRELDKIWDHMDEKNFEYFKEKVEKLTDVKQLDTAFMSENTND